MATDPLLENRKLTCDTQIDGPATNTDPPTDQETINGDRFQGALLLGSLRAESDLGTEIVTIQVWVRDNKLNAGVGAWVASETILVPIRLTDSGEASAYRSELNGQTAGVTIADVPDNVTVYENSAVVVSRNLLGF